MSSRILLEPYRVELTEKHSRFLGIGYPCQSLESFRLRKKELEQEFPDATHITYAYKIFENDQFQQRFSDDGEPAGTAGKPILMHIEGQSLINIAIFVVRYFGGVKLGAGGLVRAYGGTAKLLIQEAPIGPHIPYSEFEISIPHSQQRQLDYLSKKHQVEILERIWSEDLRVRLRMPESEKAAFLAGLS